MPQTLLTVTCIELDSSMRIHPMVSIGMKNECSSKDFIELECKKLSACRDHILRGILTFTYSTTYDTLTFAGEKNSNGKEGVYSWCHYFHSLSTILLPIEN